MPTYQYECDACGHGFEVLQSMVDKKFKKCPKCGKLKLHRLIGAGSGIIFKGTGFYETDYKRKDALKETSSAKPTSSAKAGGPGGANCCGGGACGR
ncbi:MAG: zinc ribbon domain-containing protein [Candidatus Omnitrophica bacterium]|nr:zinc ribbon domain-containing protein [Candidatus Omnitrophota bacterium]MBI5023899.1 zinc ribbon domain-containing protein [Candidatus Omnitrophota bacterium]